MPADPIRDSDSSPAFELKAGPLTLPILKLLSGDLDAVTKQLALKVEQAPGFFHNAPVLIELQSVANTDTAVDFALLVGLLRGYGMIPFGVRGGNEQQNGMAEMMELAVLSGTFENRSSSRRSSSAPAKAPRGTAAATTRIISSPVRSGQRVYAAGGDLVVVASVSSGAELLADGNIHVYGALRGRALAGVTGDASRRIFCSDLQAELVAIAGRYRVSEDIAPSTRGRPVQILLQDRTLCIDEL
jgi:septum site-determining protein MinC